jgi:DNA polymerase-4
MHATEEYKNMSAMRMVSKEQRKDLESLKSILMMLCLTLEKRLMSKHLFCKRVQCFIRYEDRTNYEDSFHTEQPIQDGMELYHILLERQHVFQQKNQLLKTIINNNTISIGVVIQNFINEDLVQLNIFDNSHLKSNKARKTVYSIKNKYGSKTIKRASELNEEDTASDVIGFGSVKDVNTGEYG